MDWLVPALLAFVGGLAGSLVAPLLGETYRQRQERTAMVQLVVQQAQAESDRLRAIDDAVEDQAIRTGYQTAALDAAQFGAVDSWVILHAGDDLRRAWMELREAKSHWDWDVQVNGEPDRSEKHLREAVQEVLRVAPRSLTRETRRQLRS